MNKLLDCLSAYIYACVNGNNYSCTKHFLELEELKFWVFLICSKVRFSRLSWACFPTIGRNAIETFTYIVHESCLRIHPLYSSQTNDEYTVVIAINFLSMIEHKKRLSVTNAQMRLWKFINRIDDVTQRCILHLFVSMYVKINEISTTFRIYPSKQGEKSFSPYFVWRNDFLSLLFLFSSCHRLFLVI